MFEPIVTRTFHEVVEEGEASFTVDVPKSYGTVVLPNSEIRHRQFYFSDLYLIPGFYKQRAAQLGLDVEDDKEAVLIDLEFRVSFTISPDLFKNADRTEDVKFQHGNSTEAVDILMKNVNAHFQVTKPQGIMHSVFFLDWIDLEWGDEGAEESNMLDHNVAIPAMVDMYYGVEEYSDAQFFDALEPSVRKLPGVNNFKFPSQAFSSPGLWSQIRVRLNIAPNTKMVVSTHTLMEQLGFSMEQLGLPKDRKRFVFENPLTDAYITMVADNPIKTGGMITGTTTTIFPGIMKKMFYSNWEKVTPKMSNFDNNSYILDLTKKAFATTSSQVNIEVDLDYVAQNKQFRVVFPANDRLGAVVHCDRDFSNRLGFEGRQNIDANVYSVPVGEKNTRVDAEGQSRAMSYDAVMVMVTMESSSSAITAGLDETLLACLYPTGSGTMAMTNRPPAQNYFSFEYGNSKSKQGDFYTTLYPRSVYLPTVYSGDKSVPVKFNIWTIGKGSKKSPLNLKVPVSIGGVLEGRI
jgi:hypothetical protein